MDWGLGNPNKTAAVIACLMVAVWALAYVRRWGFWAALSLFVGLGVALLHTFSRGGVVAALAGLLVVLCGVPRPWPRARVVAILAGLGILCGYSIYLEASDRFTLGLAAEDKSISNRIELWETAPRMMVDAPGGWGLGNSGKAYMQWYQPVDRNESYRTLVNSHLTWLVELSWPLRLGYLASWALIFWICWPSGRWRYALSICCGIWVCLAVAAFFSSVLESPWVWAVPGLALMSALGIRFAERRVHGFWTLGFEMAGCVLICLALWLAGNKGNPGTLRYGEGKVMFGRGIQHVWIVPDEDVFGVYYGTSFRKAFASNETEIAVTAEVPISIKAIHGELLVAGNGGGKARLEGIKQWLAEGGRVLLINPRFHPLEILSSAEKSKQIEVWMGEHSESPVRLSWMNRKDIRLRIFNGIGDYSASWFLLVRDQQKN